MSYINPLVLDQTLSYIASNGNALHICSDLPTTYAEATSTFSVGVKTSPSYGSLADRSGGGRRLPVNAISDGTVTDTDTATHYAIVDTSNSRLLIADELDDPVGVTDTQTFTTNAFDIGFPLP